MPNRGWASSRRGDRSAWATLIWGRTWRVRPLCRPLTWLASNTPCLHQQKRHMSFNMQHADTHRHQNADSEATCCRADSAARSALVLDNSACSSSCSRARRRRASLSARLRNAATCVPLRVRRRPSGSQPTRDLPAIQHYQGFDSSNSRALTSWPARAASSAAARPSSAAAKALCSSFCIASLSACMA